MNLNALLNRQSKVDVTLLASGAFAVLCVVVGVSMAHAFAWSIWSGLLLGAASAAPLIFLPMINKFVSAADKISAARCAELISLVYLIVISVALSIQTLPSLLNALPVQLLPAAPLLMMTAALYTVYILLNQLRRQRTNDDDLAAVFSSPPGILVLAMAFVLAIYCLLLLHYVGLNYPQLESITIRFLARGIIPPMTLVLFFWGLLLLMNKWWLLWREQRLLQSDDPQRQPALMTAWRQAAQRRDNTSASAFLEIMWKKSVDFYTIPRYINWAIPILGFIGTVLGISLAADGIQRIINTQSNVSQLSTELGQAIAPLGIAFDTTLIALSLSVLLTLLQTVLQRWEDNILIDCERRIRADAEAAN